MGEGHLFRDPLLRPDWTLGWGHEQITVGEHKDQGMGGGNWGCRTSGRGWGVDPLPPKRPRLSRIHSDTHSLLTPGGRGCPGRPGSEREQSFGERGRRGRV